MSLPGGGGAFSYRQLEQLWTSAGGNAKLAPIMAAIAMAESGGNPHARNPSGATGLWQILGNPFPGNAMDPNTNARMAVAKYHTQGLGAWTTYTSGAYKKFLQGGASATPNVTGGAAVVDEAKKFFGTPYVWGGESPKGFDCSGLVQFVAQKLGIKNMPRTSEAQWAHVQHISKDQLKPGDLVFYAGSDGTNTSPGHVAIYQGNGRIIQAEETGTNVGSFALDSAGTPVGYGRIPGVNSAAVAAGTGSGSSGGGGGGDWSAWLSDLTSGLKDVSTFSSPTNLLESLTNSIPGQITGPAGPLAGIATALANFEQHVAWFFVPNHWVRIICGVLGVPLVGLGVVTMTRTGKSYSIANPVGGASVGPVGLPSTLPAPGGELAPALGIAEVTLGAILLFVAFHNLEADNVSDWPSLLSYFQRSLQTGGATSGGG